MSYLKIDEGVEQGVRTQVHFEGDDVVIQNTFDPAPYIEYAKQARLATQGQSWGDGRFLGTIPNLHLFPILAIKDPKEREKAVMRFFRQAPDLVMFDKALK